MQKRVFGLILAVILLFSCVSCSHKYDFVSALYTVKINSTHAFVYDYSDGDVNKMYDGESEIIYPASITKLLTALTALDILPADTVITPGDEVYLSPEGASSAYIRPHHQLTLEMLIEGMMLPSGNDAAYAIAAACGLEADSGWIKYADDGTYSREAAVEVFVMKMNEYARNLGCTGSNFTTPDGFAGDEHYSTLDDMLLICKAAAENEIIMKYAAMQSDNVVYASGHTNTWVNTNLMLDPESEFYNENVIGLKTGSLAGNYSLAILYDDGENRLLIGVFGAKDEVGRYEDAETLIEAELDAIKTEEKYK